MIFQLFLTASTMWVAAVLMKEMYNYFKETKED